MAASRKPKEKIDSRYNLKTYFNFLFRYKYLLFVLLFVVLVVEVVSTVDKYLFKIVIDKGAEYVSKILSYDGYVHIVMLVLLAYFVAIVVKSGGKWLTLHLINDLDTRIMRDLKQRYFNHILHLDYNFHTTHKTGSLIARLSRGSSAIERLTDFMITQAFPLVFELGIVFASVLYFDFLTGVMVIFVTIAFISYSMFIQRLQDKPNALANEAEDIEKGNLADFYTNIESIKYYGKEYLVKQRFAALTEKTKKAFLRHWGYYRWFDAGNSLIISLGTVLLIYFPFRSFLAGNLTIGTLVFIYALYGSLASALGSFVSGIRGFYRSLADFDDLFKYGKVDNAIKDRAQAETLKIENGSIEFENVGFNYNKRKLFEKFSLKINPGEKVALVGHSGSGKTTLVRLLYRFYDVGAGKIKVDGKDIRDFKQESLRSELSIVPQEAVLFDDTIYNNVAFSKPDATRAEVLQAIKFAQLDKIIRQFPHKENTIVGERGVRLSGGEKQRVSIARAILANKRVLVLDEATSSLDSRTEHDIQKDLQQLMRGRTSIIIAHRLSTIMSADKIVVMDKGKIVQVGKHADLISRHGVYKELWNLQKGGYLKE